MKPGHKNTQDINLQPKKSGFSSWKELVQSQDHNVHRCLLVATTFILILAAIIFLHEGFVLISRPQSAAHSLVHLLLLVVVIPIFISSKNLWKSYRHLTLYQASLLASHDELEKTNHSRTRALGKSESLLETMFNAFEERTVVVDSEFRIFRANKAAIAWVGYDPGGYLFTEVFPECDPDCERRSESRLIKSTFDTAATYRNRLIRGGKDCALMLSIDTYPVIKSEGDIKLVIEVARDVTKQKKNDLFSRHREKMAAIGMLAAGFTHELGNPLTSLSTELELLERNPDKSRLQETIAQLKEHMGRINRILHQIRGFAQQRNTGSRETRIDNVIRDVLRLLAFDPRAKGVRIQVDVSDSLPPVSMPEDDLYLVLINLMINAFQAMPDGGTLTISAKSDRDGGSCLTVSDTGVGMEPAVLSRAILPLFTTKSDTGGTGLGLSLCSDLLDAAGARLSISSTPGKGTTVKVNFPTLDNQDDISGADTDGRKDSSSRR